MKILGFNLSLSILTTLKRLTEINCDIFTLLCVASRRFYPFEATKRSLKIKRLCHFNFLKVFVKQN